MNKAQRLYRNYAKEAFVPMHETTNKAYEKARDELSHYLLQLACHGRLFVQVASDGVVEVVNVRGD